MTKLQVELVPRSCFFSNLRSNLKKRDWDYLRAVTAEKAGYRCEICGSTGNGYPLECHEIWQYDDETFVQSLIGLVSLCKACHRAKHMALARRMGWDGAAENHLMRVNGWSRAVLTSYLDEAFAVFEIRSGQEWQLDITWLQQYDVVIPPVLDRNQRKE